MAIEEPKYTVELSANPFEVRDYAPTVVATVHIDGDRSDAVGAGFRILASYIFGNNESKTKIAMTSPVTQNAGQEKAMTAPVQQAATSGGWDIRFTMPLAYTLATLPKPRDSRVSFAQTPEKRMAVVTFSGFWSDANFHTQEDQLFDFLKEYQLTATSTPIYAYYNPPWTPWFLRRNEVLVEVGNGHQGTILSK